MKTKVQRLPKNAVYDYTDVNGYKVYHTAYKRYEVVTRNRFGKKETCIYSMNKEDKIMKRKYLNFIVETEDEDAWETPWWRAAFCAYQRNKSCTIYGLPNYDGANYEVIMSK